MTDESLIWYLDFIQRELQQLNEGKFTGNIEFQVNHKEGSVANMNVCLRKSVRHIVKDN